MKGVLGDLQIVVEQHSDILRNNALPFRVLIAIRTLGLVISPIAAAYESVALLPFQLFTIEVWRLITCHFVGPNILLYAWTVWSLHFGTNLIRQNNCNESLLKIYAITQILTVLIVCGAAYGLYAVAAKTSLLYETYIVDMVPLNCAVLVLIKQTYKSEFLVIKLQIVLFQFLPDTILLETSFGRIKYTHLPIMAILLISLLYLVGIVRPVTILQGLLAVQISWTYLRFFNTQDSEGTCGDSSEHFVWASLFPRATQPFFTVLGRICFRSLVKLGVCKRTVSKSGFSDISVSLQDF
ncbi:unnamed protein product [Haemonchus placei]|uniref:Transmembrane protein 115 n=1 Tax=Haemonchus placei TaxID=6290 RepID=A0A0N4W0R7_HAEPC|nr:unnamed protein product [Haemonchus placei]